MSQNKIPFNYFPNYHLGWYRFLCRLSSSSKILAVASSHSSLPTYHEVSFIRGENKRKAKPLHYVLMIGLVQLHLHCGSLVRWTLLFAVHMTVYVELCYLVWPSFYTAIIFKNYGEVRLNQPTINSFIFKNLIKKIDQFNFLQNTIKCNQNFIINY